MTAALFLVIGFLACYIPALRTTRINAIEALRHDEGLEFHPRRPRALERFADAALLHQPAHERTVAAVNARLDARVIADRDKAGLNRAQRAVHELAQEDIPVIDVHAHPRAGGPDHPLRHEVPHRSHDCPEIVAHEAVGEIDDGRAIALER